MSARQALDALVANVVSVPGIAWARIAETYDQLQRFTCLLHANEGLAEKPAPENGTEVATRQGACTCRTENYSG